VAATLGSVFPPVILVTILAFLYMKYRQMDVLQYVLRALRPAVVAMIATAGVSMLVTSLWDTEVMGIETIKIAEVTTLGICLFLLMKWKVDPVKVMLRAGVLNVIASVIIGAF